MMARGLAVGAGALIGVLPQLAVNYHLFGNPFTTGYFGEGFPDTGARRGCSSR